MSHHDHHHREHRRYQRASLWIGIGAIVLIILLIVWLTIADLWGDTDVAANIPLLGII